MRDPCRTLDEILQELREKPLDLLSVGDGAGETAYLEHARTSYLRTLRDVLRIADSLQAAQQPIRILEIGAYLGVVSRVLARLGFTVTALDIPEFMENRRLLEQYAGDGVATVSANLREYPLPLATGAYTLVIMCETLEHLNFNPLPVMADINRVLAPGGRLYLSLPNQASLVNRAKLLIGRSIHNPVDDFVAQLSRQGNMIVGIHWREYTALEVRELLTNSGFDSESHEFFVTHRPGAVARLAYRLFPRLRPNQTVCARKGREADHSFHFTGATR